MTVFLTVVALSRSTEFKQAPELSGSRPIGDSLQLPVADLSQVDLTECHPVAAVTTPPGEYLEVTLTSRAAAHRQPGLFGRYSVLDTRRAGRLDGMSTPNVRHEYLISGPELCSGACTPTRPVSPPPDDHVPHRHAQRRMWSLTSAAAPATASTRPTVKANHRRSIRSQAPQCRTPAGSASSGWAGS